MRGVRWRVMVSALGGIAWIIFFLLFVAFIPTGFTLFQSIAVILAVNLGVRGRRRSHVGVVRHAPLRDDEVLRVGSEARSASAADPDVSTVTWSGSEPL